VVERQSKATANDQQIHMQQAKVTMVTPTSVGSSDSLGKMTTLPATLNSCSADVAMVNIKNGFESDFVAALIKR
jgi:NCAIR mutase (PurE)-related protein